MAAADPSMEQIFIPVNQRVVIRGPIPGNAGHLGGNRDWVVRQRLGDQAHNVAVLQYQAATDSAAITNRIDNV